MNANIENLETEGVVGKCGVKKVNKIGQYLNHVCCRGIVSGKLLVSAKADPQVYLGKEK